MEVSEEKLRPPFISIHHSLTKLKNKIRFVIEVKVFKVVKLGLLKEYTMRDVMRFVHSLFYIFSSGL